MLAIPIIFLLISIAFFVSAYKKASTHHCILDMFMTATHLFLISPPIIISIGIIDNTIEIDPKTIDYLIIASINSIINIALFLGFAIHDNKTKDLIYNEAIKRGIKKETIKDYVFFYLSNKQFKNGFENLMSKLIQEEKFKKVEKPKEPKKSVTENIEALFSKNTPNLA